MNNVIDFEEIKLAKRIVKDAPNIIRILDNCQKALYPYREYIDAYEALSQLHNSQIMLEIYLKAYELLLEQNGVKK